MVKMSEVVNWEKVLEQVQGDEEFLIEVLGDLLKEARESEVEIAEGIEKRDWDCVSKAAHRVKGSSAYLNCEQMRVCSSNLQNLGHDALAAAATEKIDEIARSIISWFAEYRESVNRVESAIKERYGDRKLG